MAKAKAEAKADTPEGDEVEVLKHDAAGQGYIPGAEPKVVKKLNASVIEWKRLVKARMSLAAQEAEAKSEWQSLAKKNLNHFVLDDETGDMVYSAGGVTIRIKHIEDEKISAEVDSEINATIQ